MILHATTTFSNAEQIRSPEISGWLSSVALSCMFLEKFRPTQSILLICPLQMKELRPRTKILATAYGSPEFFSRDLALQAWLFYFTDQALNQTQNQVFPDLR